MVSVSRLEVVFSKSNVYFGGVIVARVDGGLVLRFLLNGGLYQSMLFRFRLVGAFGS